MVGFLAGSALAFVDLVAMGVAAGLAAKAGNRDIPTFFKNVIGAVCGVVVEIARVGVVYVVVRMFYGAGPEWDFSRWVAFLVTFRVFNIPIVVGVGFSTGGAAGRQLVACPNCKKPLELDATYISGKADQGTSIAIASPPPDTHTETCPHCRARIVISTADLSIERWEAAPAGDEPAAASPDALKKL